jgi:hypothetical protein
MAHSVTIKTGKNNVFLPNGLEYNNGQSAVLTNDQFAQLSASAISTYVTDNGVVAGAEGVNQGVLVAQVAATTSSAPSAVTSAAPAATTSAAPGALTGAAAAGSAPTKTEYDKTVADVVALRGTLAAVQTDLVAQRVSLAASQADVVALRATLLAVQADLVAHRVTIAALRTALTGTNLALASA